MGKRRSPPPEATHKSLEADVDAEIITAPDQQTFLLNCYLQVEIRWREGMTRRELGQL